MNVPSFTTLVAVLLIPVLAGCKQPAKSAGSGSPIHTGVSTSWNDSAAHPVGGIDHASVEYVKFGDRLSLLFWTDLANGGAQTGSTSSSEGISFKCTFQSPNLKKPLEFEVRSQTPNSGSLTIDATPYDLANGSLFLVSTKGERPVIKQLKSDLTQIKTDVESLKAMAKADPAISGFFTEQDKK